RRSDRFGSPEEPFGGGDIVERKRSAPGIDERVDRVWILGQEPQGFAEPLCCRVGQRLDYGPGVTLRSDGARPKAESCDQYRAPPRARSQKPGTCGHGNFR